MATYYKVVRKNSRSGYRSAVVNGKPCLSYVLGERTVGFEGMPVLLFNSLYAARDFAEDESTYQKVLCILAGKAGRPRRQGFVCGVWRGLFGFRAFWGGDPDVQDNLAWDAPKDTYAADWFEPERVVRTI